jgi:DNA-binding transcriptional LysR family regulator
MALELRQLRHVLALAQHGSVGRAASALRMTQPALSRSLRQIEWETGSVLFSRSPSGVSPTDQGLLLLRRARELVDAADELDREVVHQRVGGTGQLHVGAGPYPADTLLPVALARFLTRHDSVRVRINVPAKLEDLPKLLRAHQIDFFVADYTTFVEQDDLNLQPLERHQAFFMARKRHPLAARAFDLPALFGYPFVAASQYPPRALQPMLALRRPVEARRPGRPFPSVEFGSVAAVKTIVADTDAITALPLPLAATELKRGSLVALGTAPWSYIHYAIVSLKSVRLSDAASDFVSLIKDAEASLTRLEKRLASKYDPATQQPVPRRARTQAAATAERPS